MPYPKIPPIKYSKLRSIYKYYIDSYIALYQLKTENEEELRKIYKMIKMELIDSKKCHPKNVIKNILNIILYNNRYAKSYLELAKLIFDEYHVNEVSDIINISNFLFYKEYGIKLNNSQGFGEIKLTNLDVHSEDTIYRAIMYNDLDIFISFTEREGFNKNKKLKSSLYPESKARYSLLELCCYHGAIDCFKFLRVKFNSKITQTCLQFSFLGRNKEILSECLKYQKPDEECMEYAIISHNIDFVTFLMKEHNIGIDLFYCAQYNNLESMLVYSDHNYKDYFNFNKCLLYSGMFEIASLCEYFISHGAFINVSNSHRQTTLHFATINDCKEIVELLLLHDANINKKDIYGKTALHWAAYYNSKETVELLISYGVNINEKDDSGYTALDFAACFNHYEIAQLLISNGANISEKVKNELTALHFAGLHNSKETVGLLISYGVNINQKDKTGYNAFNFATHRNSQETAELLISYGATINAMIARMKIK
ncbi:hypothetical protein TVAG_379030 [Trichomonas vaginalis G3]|uniref:DUF3447 domain-containing protein n=1 Tax=Trichomonas vaginalis (strain ATCC PRA-98 / G3) TaxID=412133 RepID=A2DB94_TRIV3|nr:proteasome regulatory particle assembly [Trichomonas vaginalis G3]EAY22424.1 hypothetical protein TVAG_379030 [Trichomonas vaginalis G3]KAI5517629.1 proteasome regulatory particle assembly [Trichomonas vaginalis G3]|eukprot:XP_001583410.1 hypothetical protein [Trichomonas vaginalis G3]